MSRILVVDDNRSNLELMKYLLTAFGHDVTTFDASAAALEEALRNHYDLILADVRMPGMDGFEFVRRVKTEAAAPSPVVAVTALAMVGDRERMLAAGFDGYIAKPIDPEQFQAQVSGFLAPRGGDGPLILAVDDIAVNLEVLAHTLTPFGFRVTRASSVDEAIEKLKRERPALIISDIHMPNVNGFELIEYVKNDPELRDIPVFVMSSTAWQTRDKNRAMKLGADRFVLRPIEPERLLAEVRSALER